MGKKKGGMSVRPSEKKKEPRRGSGLQCAQKTQNARSKTTGDLEEKIQNS